MGRTALRIGLACALLTACSSSSVDGYIPPLFHSGVTVAFTTEGPVSTALAKELGKRGYRVMERARLDAVITEHALPGTGFAKGQLYVKAGQIVNVPYLLTVLDVLFWKDPDKPVSVNVKIVDVKSGEVVGDISYTNSSMGRTGSPFDEMHKKSSSVVAQEIAEYIDDLSRPSSDLLQKDAGLK